MLQADCHGWGGRGAASCGELQQAHQLLAQSWQAVLRPLSATAVALRSLSSFRTGANPAHVQGGERAYTIPPLRHGTGEGHVGASNGLDQENCEYSALPSVPCL